jgi:DHA2 family multidrug resistance protein
MSLTTVGAAMWYYSTFNLATDYSHYALARAFQGLGYGFFFVPVNVLAYSQLRPDQNNRASSLTNLFRNWGGSFGIAFITTATERRHQFHQTNLGSAIGATSQQLGDRITALTNYLVTKGLSGSDAAMTAQAYLHQQFQRQVSLLSFLDCFRIIAWLTLAAGPLLLFVRRFKPPGKAPASH